MDFGLDLKMSLDWLFAVLVMIWYKWSWPFSFNYVLIVINIFLKTCVMTRVMIGLRRQMNSINCTIYNLLNNKAANNINNNSHMDKE